MVENEVVGLQEEERVRCHTLSQRMKWGEAVMVKRTTGLHEVRACMGMMMWTHVPRRF